MNADVADRIALQDVMLRYAQGCDEKDFDLYRSCFADEVEVSGMAEETISGLDPWMAFVKQALTERFGSTQHMLGPQLATVDGDTAHCRTDVQALHELKASPGALFILWATYETEMQRREGQWKIVRHRLVTRSSRTVPPPG